jgi:hypothetical protein
MAVDVALNGEAGFGSRISHNSGHGLGLSIGVVAPSTPLGTKEVSALLRVANP